MSKQLYLMKMIFDCMFNPMTVKKDWQTAVESETQVRSEPNAKGFDCGHNFNNIHTIRS